MERDAAAATGGTALLKRLAAAVEGFVTQLQCAICLCAYANPASLPCNHCFCEECIHRALELKPVCPICKAPAKKRKLRYDSMIQQLLLATEMLSVPAAEKGAVAVNGDKEADDAVLLLEEKPMALSLSNGESAEHQPQPSESGSKPLQSQGVECKRNGHAHVNAAVSTAGKLPPIAPVRRPKDGREPVRGDTAVGEIIAESTGSTPNGSEMVKAQSVADTTAAMVAVPASDAETIGLDDKQDSVAPPAAETPTVSSDAVATGTHSVPAERQQFPLNGPFCKGQLVEVESRTWIGINKLGGAARITQVNGDDTYNVKYVLEPRNESNIHDYFIKKPNSELAADMTPSRAVKQRRSAKCSMAGGTPSSGEKSVSTPAKGGMITGKRKRLGMVFLCSGYDVKTTREIEKWSELLDAEIVSHWSSQVTHLIVKCVVGDKPNGAGSPTEAHDRPGKRQLFSDTNPVKRWVKIRSMKYLKALVGGRWIVSEEWLQGTLRMLALHVLFRLQEIANWYVFVAVVTVACFAHGGYVSEVDFEADGHLKGRNIDDAVRRSRKRRQEILQTCPATVDPASVGTRLFEDFCFHLVGDFLPPMPPQSELDTLLRIGGGKPICVLDDIVREMTKEENGNRQLVIVCDRINPVALRATSKHLKSLPQLSLIPDVLIVNYQWVLNSISEAKLRPFKRSHTAR